MSACDYCDQEFKNKKYMMAHRRDTCGKNPESKKNKEKDILTKTQQVPPNKNNQQYNNNDNDVFSPIARDQYNYNRICEAPNTSYNILQGYINPELEEIEGTPTLLSKLTRQLNTTTALVGTLAEHFDTTTNLIGAIIGQINTTTMLINIFAKQIDITSAKNKLIEQVNIATQIIGSLRDFCAGTFTQNINTYMSPDEKKVTNNTQTNTKNNISSTTNNTVMKNKCTEIVNNIFNKNVNNNVNNNVSNKKINIKNTNNVVMLNNLSKFGCEDIKKLSEEDVKDIFLSGGWAAHKMFVRTHANDLLPEYKNIYVSDEKGNMIILYDGDGWVSYQKKSTLEDIFTKQIKGLTILINDHQDIYKKLPSTEKEAFKDLLHIDYHEKQAQDTVKKIWLHMCESRNDVRKNYDDIKKGLVYVRNNGLYNDNISIIDNKDDVKDIEDNDNISKTENSDNQNEDSSHSRKINKLRPTFLKNAKPIPWHVPSEDSTDSDSILEPTKENSKYIEPNNKKNHNTNKKYSKSKNIDDAKNTQQKGKPSKDTNTKSTNTKEKKTRR